MVRRDTAGVLHAYSLHHLLQGEQGLLVKVVHPVGLVGHDQALLAQRVLGGDPGGAVPGVAVLGLDAAQREHEAARAVAPVGTQGHQASNVKSAHHLPRHADFDALPQAGTAQRVVYQQQPLLHWRAHVVSELQRCCAGAALRTVHDNEVGGDAGLQHGLYHGKPLPWVTDAELDTRRLATRELAQAGDEMHHFYGRRKSTVGSG